MELCGGTHVSNTGQIGSIKILSENGVAAGVRRIEAITGAAVSRMLAKEQSVIQETSEILKTNSAGLIKKAESVSEELKALRKEVESLKLMSISTDLEEILQNAKVFNGIRLVTKVFENVDINDMRSISDQIKSKEKAIILVFASVNEDKVTMMTSVSDDLLDKGFHAGNMIKEIVKAVGGSGGGKADMAQAGAKDASKLPEAFSIAEALLQSKI